MNNEQRENEYNNIINSLMNIKHIDSENFTELNTRINVLESKNIQLADLFEQIVTMLKR